MNIWKSTKVYTAFLFMGHAFWKGNIEDRVKLLKSNVLNCCPKVTTSDLHKIGLNPLNPKIKIENLICCSYTFSIEVVRRIC